MDSARPVDAPPLVDLDQLVELYFGRQPDPTDSERLVSFGTSGHRGTSLQGTFTEGHIHAIAQAICDYRRFAEIDGPLYIGKDTHGLSAPAQDSALEVLAANGVNVFLQAESGFTPTPAISRAILAYNRGRTNGFADGIVITPSHNPPEDGGFKYNPPNGGPAESDVTRWIQDRANELIQEGLAGVKRLSLAEACKAACVHEIDFVGDYVADLANVIDFESIRSSGVKIGVDPMGGASVDYYDRIADQFGLELTVVNDQVDAQFGFMPADHDGKIRMDCSSPFAMANLIGLKDSYDIAFGNDPDADRHGIVTRSSGLLNPNHFLAVAIRYLLTHRDGWPDSLAIGKTAVSSAIIDRVVGSLGRRVLETPVGFKWFAPGLYDGTLAFGGEESAGASFVRKDGTVWTTDKDGILMGLLAAEIMARTAQDPGEHFQEIAAQFGQPFYRRVDQPATPEVKSALAAMTAETVTATMLAGEPIVQKLNRAPGNDAPIGGIKLVANNGWFAARPSGTENIYKIYAESFRDEAHLNRILAEASELIGRASQV